MKKCDLYYNKELADSLISYYLNNKSLSICSEKFKISPSAIYNFLKYSNIYTSKKYQIEESFFNKIDTRSKAYIYGWLLSDGSMNDKSTSKQIRLKITDIDILNKIKSELNYGQNLYETNCKLSKKETKLLVISSSIMFNDLVNHGCTPRKSFTKKFPTSFPDSLIPDFIRGYFEGNGSIYIYKNRSKNISGEIKIVSSAFLCNGMMNYLSTKGIFSYIDKDKRCDDRVSNLRIRRLSDVKLFMELIYNNIEDGLFLKRKHDKFLELINN